MPKFIPKSCGDKCIVILYVNRLYLDLHSKSLQIHDFSITRFLSHIFFCQCHAFLSLLSLSLTCLVLSLSPKVPLLLIIYGRYLLVSHCNHLKNKLRCLKNSIIFLSLIFLKEILFDCKKEIE